MIKVTSKDFQKAVRIVRTSKSALSCWDSLLRYAETRVGQRLEEFRQTDVLIPVEEVVSALKALWMIEPYPENLSFLYFGIFDLALPPSRKPYVGYYVSGGVKWSATNSDCLCDLPYFPEGRLLRSGFLDDIRRRGGKHPDICEFYEYFLVWGGAALLSKWALLRLGIIKKCVVGFDEGDFALVLD